jgi:hypothetical protein
MMFNDKARIKGQVTAIVRGPDGEIKTFNANPLISWMPLNWQKRFSGVFKGLTYKGQPMVVVNHNIVTDEGDAMVADLCAQTPARTKVDNTNGYIEVGTGYVSEIKSNTSCTTPTGSPEVMDATYPQTKGAWGAANDNVTVYRATFEAGDLNASGIDEAALLNNATATAADCLAYAQITPAVNVTTSDTLEVTWELTFTGS